MMQLFIRVSSLHFIAFVVFNRQLVKHVFDEMEYAKLNRIKIPRLSP